VALDLILEVLLPVEADRARNVGLGIEGGILVHLDDADRIVVEVRLDPIGLHQYLVRVVAHLLPPNPYRVFSLSSESTQRARPLTGVLSHPRRLEPKPRDRWDPRAGSP